MVYIIRVNSSFISFKKKKTSPRVAIPFNPYKQIRQLDPYELTRELDARDLIGQLDSRHLERSTTKLIQTSQSKKLTSHLYI